MPWDHEYVQCRLQNSLYAIANHLPYSSEICLEKMPEHIQNIRPIELDFDGLAAIEPPQLIKSNDGVDNNNNDDDNDIDAAAVQYEAPSYKFADEVYFPPMKRRQDYL